MMVRRTIVKTPLPHIRVLNPVTHHTWDEGRYTTYDISIQTEHKSFSLKKSTVTRRFSEFVWLRKQLKSQHSTRTPPDLPPKKFFMQRFDDEFIEKRRDGLENFLNKVIGEAMFLSDTVLHLFLQTELSSLEMDDFVKGKLSDDFITMLWKSGGKKKKEKNIGHSPDRLSVTSTEDSCQSDILSGSRLSTESTMSSQGSSMHIEEGDNSNQSQNKGHNSTSTPVRQLMLLECQSSPRFSINNKDGTLSD